MRLVKDVIIALVVAALTVAGLVTGALVGYHYGAAHGYASGYQAAVEAAPKRGHVAPCPVSPLSHVTTTDIENGYTCLTVTARVVKVDSLAMDPPRYVVKLEADGTPVNALWPGGVDVPEPGARIQAVGIVVSLGRDEWGLVITEWEAGQ